MSDRSKSCATCGKPRGSLEQRRENWGYDPVPPLVPRRPDEADGKSWQSTDGLIVYAGVYRNGGTDESCHLCDDCLRIGLRKIKQEVDEALGVIEKDADKDRELAELTQRLASIQHEVAEVKQLRAAGIPWYAWNHTPFLRAVAMLWSYYMEPESTFTQRFGDFTYLRLDFWGKLREMLDAWQKERKEQRD